MQSRLERRGFLKTLVCGATVAAATQRRSSLSGEAKVEPVPATVRAKPSKVIRVGVVGGNFGCSFYWHEHPNSRVAAVCDIRPDRLERMKKVFRCDTGYGDFHELIKDKNVDAVAVFTPAPLHVYHATQAMLAGKDVISAVPAAMSLEECEQLLECVKKTGRAYMMAETSRYRQEIISCKKWADEGKFGTIFYSEAEYHHGGLDRLMYDERGLPTWRLGFPPMHYPTHSTSMIVCVTGERLTEATAVGWGDGHEILQTNLYENPFWNETAFFKTSGGHCARVSVFWNVASGGTERGQFFGDKMSYTMGRPGAVPGMIGYPAPKERMEVYNVPQWWKTELPEPLRHDSGHGGSHTFLTHEFIDALVNGRRPAVDVYEAIAYTAPGIVAHQSSLHGGKTIKIPDFGRAPV
ncbi:Gfo/Idh/MocA family oxidoreductase [Candidatus Sumerlaeota bacterium]|nr:Gfo/Idh/MocA family oxidoreductase [Candidatus Sumerlaeota bacterium]